MLGMLQIYHHASQMLNFSGRYTNQNWTFPATTRVASIWPPLRPKQDHNQIAMLDLVHSLHSNMLIHESSSYLEPCTSKAYSCLCKNSFEFLWFFKREFLWSISWITLRCPLDLNLKMVAMASFSLSHIYPFIASSENDVFPLIQAKFHGSPWAVVQNSISVQFILDTSSFAQATWVLK